ncbi:MAG TPA: XRE family transcriptional regulator [Microvirga sp.]|jgi:transcriptional regulator with XRE-family HTH domain|nr:XRE family transcriptional regulator [Microvirga sp.]
MDAIDQRIAHRIRTERQRHALTLEALAERSGVSRAMISRIERAEASATAALLGRLCAGLGISLAALFADDAKPQSPVSRAADQPVWRDPASGYLRRDVAPRGTGSPVEIVDVTFPPGARVAFKSPWLVRGIDQHVWVLDGTLELTLGATLHRLETGDCVHVRLDEPIAYRNPTDRAVRYAVILTLEKSRA